MAKGTISNSLRMPSTPLTKATKSQNKSVFTVANEPSGWFVRHREEPVGSFATVKNTQVTVTSSTHDEHYRFCPCPRPTKTQKRRV